MIATIGDLVEDVVVWTDEPFHLGADTAARIVRTRGGSAANVAALVAAAGGRARFIGNVGNDELGTRLLETLASTGVDLRVQRAGRTGSLVAVVTPDGERSFLTDRGSASELTSADPAWIEACDALHVPAYCFAADPLAATSAALVTIASAHGVIVSIDTSSTSLIASVGVGTLLDLITHLTPTVLFANREEAAALGLGPGEPAPGATTTVVRDGATRTWVVDASGATDEVPVPPVDGVVDTTGAGDAFAAGWLLAATGGASPVEATHHAHHLASLVLTQPGATLGGPLP